jgi:hypothetical protein
MRRLVALASVAALIPVFVAAGLAWACTPQAEFTQFSPSSGGPGTVVAIAGRNFVANQPITIHWGSASGPVIGTAQGPEFSTTVTVPQAPGDVYAIVAVTTGPNPSLTGQGRGAFTMVTPSTPSGQGSTSATTSGATAGAGSQSANAQPGQSSATTSGAPAASSQRGSASATVRGRSSAGSSAAAFPQRQPAAGNRSGSAAATPPVAGTSGTTQVASRATAPAAGRTSAAAGRSSSARPQGPATFAPPVAAGATEPSATGDLWSGFDPAQSAGAASAGPAAVVDGAGNSPATLGVVLLAIGLVGLTGGAAAAEARRRRRARARLHS